MPHPPRNESRVDVVPKPLSRCEADAGGKIQYEVIEQELQNPTLQGVCNNEASKDIN